MVECVAQALNASDGLPVERMDRVALVSDKHTGTSTGGSMIGTLSARGKTWDWQLGEAKSPEEAWGAVRVSERPQQELARGEKTKPGASIWK